MSPRPSTQTRALAAALALLALVMTMACGGSSQLPAEEAERLEGVFRAGLTSTEPYMRADTVRCLGLVNSPELAPLLESALGDDDPMVRGNAALKLSRLDAERTRSLLVELLTGENAEARRAMARELFSVGSPAARDLELVSIALRTQDPEVRRRATLFGLVAAMNITKDPKIRERELHPVLSNLVEDEDPRLSGMALRALVDDDRQDRLDDVLEQARKGSTQERRVALRVLAEARIESTAAALEKIEASTSGQVQVEARLALTAMGSDAHLDTAREALSGAGVETTIHILRALGWTRSGDALRIMRPYREDSRPEVRLAVTRAMAHHAGVEARDFRRGLRDEDPEVAIAAVQAMIEATPAAASGLLRDEISDPTHGARALQVLVSTLMAMELNGDIKQLDRFESQIQNLDALLQARLTDDNAFVRAAAAELVFRRADPLKIFEGIKEPSVEVTYALLDALAKSPPPDEPLRHLEFFKRFSDAQLVSLSIVAGAGIWNAYRVAAMLEAQGS